MTRIMLGTFLALVALAGCTTLCKVPLVSSALPCPSPSPTPIANLQVR